jgi:transposase
MPKPHQVPSQDSRLEKESPGIPSVKSASQETVPPGERRNFSAAEKLRLVNAAADAVASGRKGALQEFLREEGIYSSHLSTWRRQLGIYGEAGLAPRKRGRKPKLDAKDRQLLAALKENAGLEKKLRVANALIALQKKAHEILGLTMTEGER